MNNIEADRMTELDKAIELAVRAHAGQVDMDGLPHVMHCLRVASSPHLSDYGRIVAVLHDVLEDCDQCYEEEILEVFGNQIHNDVTLLSKQVGDEGEKGYLRFIKRILAGDSVEAKLVKHADILDNLGRLGTVYDEKRRIAMEKKYKKALKLFIA
jgi:(p)ppGpp synthase/HD superfamily hydrolase